MGVLIVPALSAAALFAVLFWNRRHRTSLLAAVLWALYGLYEYAMKMRILCSGDCNIRVDLLVIWPLLLIITAKAIFSALRR